MTDVVADRLAVTDGLHRYAYAIDDRDLDAVRAVFTSDAHLDYTASGGPAGGRDEVVDWIGRGLALLGATQHVVTNALVDLDGDTATSRCYLVNPLLTVGDDPTIVLLGGEYRDRWRRTADGWRIVDRTHLVTWTHTLP